MSSTKLLRSQGVTAPAGFRAAGIAAGIKKSGAPDLALVFNEGPDYAAAGVFTRNQVKAAPVLWTSQALTGGRLRAVLLNSGGANACTGPPGFQDTHATAEAVAATLSNWGTETGPIEVAVCSTGLIGDRLPMARVLAGVTEIVHEIHAGLLGGDDAARAIMTTDTVPKAFSRQVEIAGQRISVSGISKGAGMIRPNMATMLGFIATDACVDQALMPQLAKALADASFNRVTVDGDTSTNDSLVVIATNKAANASISSLDGVEGQALFGAMREVAQLLAQAIVRDGEGATKFIRISVEGGRNAEECRLAAYAIAHSPLVKTAFFASDPNLGRILAAVGYAGISDLDQTGIELYLDDVHVVTKGGRHPDYREEQGQQVMKQSEITVRVLLGRGSASDQVWTCDLSHDYVSINADYRS